MLLAHDMIASLRHRKIIKGDEMPFKLVKAHTNPAFRSKDRAKALEVFDLFCTNIDALRPCRLAFNREFARESPGKKIRAGVANRSACRCTQCDKVGTPEQVQKFALRIDTF